MLRWLTKRTMDRIEEIAQTLARINDRQILVDFFRSLLTEKEIHDISSRWELVKQLDEGISQRQISSQLGLSLCKITRGSRELKKKSSAFKQVINLHRRNLESQSNHD